MNRFIKRACLSILAAVFLVAPSWGANRDIIRLLRDSSSVTLSGVAKTATFSSESISPKDYEEFGLILDIGTVSGTSPTLDIKIQMSLNGGTTWLDTYSDALNSETQAILAQITATKETSEFWENRMTLAGSGGIDPRVKFVFTVGGTDTPTFTFTNAWIVLRYRSR